MKIRIISIILTITALFGAWSTAQAQNGAFQYKCGFNNGLDGWEDQSGLPAKWIIGQGNAARYEEEGGFATGPDAAFEGSGYAYVNMTANPVHGKEVAMSKTFNFETTANPMLSLQAHSLWTQGDGASLTVSARETGDMYYRELITQYENMGGDWYKLNSCLSRYAGKPSVEIKVSVVNNGAKPPNIAIDNLIIEDFVLETEVKDASCYGSKDGSVKVRAIGAGPLYMYSIDHEASYEQSSSATYQKSGLKAGAYATFVTDVQSGCKATDLSVQVKQPPEIQVDAEVSDLTCYGDNSGRLEIRAKEMEWGADVSNLPYEYSIDGGLTYSFGNTFKNLAGGKYSVAVRNINGCISEHKTVSIGEDVLLEIARVDFANIERCHGDNTGSIYVSANFRNNGPLDYSIDGGRTYHNGLNTFSGLTAGKYQIVVKDKNGCTANLDSNVVITEPSQFEYESITPSPIDGCHGDSNGAIAISVSGGTAPYSYSINNGITFDPHSKFGGLAAGTYKVSSMDAMGCRSETRNIEVTEPDELEILAVDIDNVEQCYGDKTGHIEITARGGTGALKYEVTATLSKLQENKHFYGLAAGKYIPYVVDEKRCQAVGQQVEITQPAKFTIASASKYDSDIRCYGDKDGLIYVLANGGTLPYTYTVDGYASSITTEKMESCTFSGLAAGKYTVQARDSKGCKADDKHLEIEQPSQLTITGIAVENVKCYGDKSGSATLTAKGGIEGYSYGYSRNNERTFHYSISPTIADLGAEEYDFAVKDANGCLAYKNSITISQPDELEFLTINTYPVTGCYGDSTGSIILGAKGGSSPYYYSIDGGNQYQKENTFLNLPGGNGYTPAVKDEHGCFVIAMPETISEPNELRINNINYTEVQGCKGSKAGSISFEAQGGTGNLTYMANSYVSQDGKFSKLQAGIYNLLVFDERGCTIKRDGIEITEPDEIIIDSTATVNENCYGDHIGKYTIYAKGGRALQNNFPYKFFLNGAQDPTNYDGIFDQLTAGNYKYRMEDKYGCTLEGRFTITEPEEFAIKSIDSSSVRTCNDDKTGYIKVGVKGGKSPVIISASGLNYYKETSDGIFSNLGANQYEIIATDYRGCKADAYVTLYEPTKVSFEAKLAEEIKCYDNGAATITTSAWGGTGSSYMVSLDNGATFTQQAGEPFQVPEGKYRIVVKDENGCLPSYYRDITVTRPSRLEAFADGQDVICHDGNTGKIVTSVSGGTKPYSFSIDRVSWLDNNNVIGNLSDGKYTVYVRDYYGCETSTSEVTIKRPENYAGFTVDVTEGCSPLEILITQDHDGNATYTFSNGDIVANRTGPTRHSIVNDSHETKIYQITSSLLLSSKGGCTDTASAYITVHPQPEVKFALNSDSLEWPRNKALITNLSKNIEAAKWDFGDGTYSSNINEDSHEYATCGYYNIMLTASDGRCSDTAEHALRIEGRKVLASFNVSKTEGCEPETFRFENTSSTMDSCMWDFGDGDSLYNAFSPIHTYTAPGQYNATLTVFGDCGTQVAATKSLEVFPKPSAAFSQNLDTIYSDQFLRLSNESSGNDQYLWKFGDGQTSTDRNPTHIYQKDGIYDISLTVTTEHYCSDTATVYGAVVVISHPIVVFPTAFSPNSDGINDIFAPVHGDVKQYEIVILNNKGNVMYRSENINEGWDGTRNGIHCPPGLYVYKAKVVMHDDKFTFHVGKIILVR